MTHPASAMSAGVALADQFLGDEPFSNPAIAKRSYGVLSPLMLRMNRQDLRADNRNFDERAAFFDGSGAWLSFPWSSLTVGVYGYQPVLRLEDNAFERGNFVIPTPPAILQTTTSMREMRGGLSVATSGRMRFGLAAEWDQVLDRWEQIEQSGSPDAGTRTLDFSGGAPGAQAGMHMDFGPGDEGTFSLGASARYVPEITVDGTQQWDLISGSGSATVSATRDAGVEGGVSLRWVPIPTTSLGAGFGGSTAQEWTGFGVTAGTRASWSGSIAYHDPREAWTVRFGLGMEMQEGVPEPRATVLGLGIGWKLDQTLLDFGVLHRSFERNDAPTSFDDRVVVSVGFDL